MKTRRSTLGIISGSVALSGCIDLGDQHKSNQDGVTQINEHATLIGGSQVLTFEYEVDLSEGEWYGAQYNVNYDCRIYIEPEPDIGSMQVVIGHERDLYGYRRDGNLDPHLIRVGSDEIARPSEILATTRGTWRMLVDNSDYFDGFNPTGDVSGRLKITIEVLGA